MNDDLASRAAHQLRYRPTVSDDVDECVDALLPTWLGLDASARAALPSLWQRLLDEQAVSSTVMEDLAKPPGQRLQGWGCGFGIDPATARRFALDGHPAPDVASQLYTALLDGSLQLPDDRELGRLNAAGEFRYVNLHYAQRSIDFSDPYAASVLNVAHEAFRAAAGGYAMQAMYIETSVAEEPVMLAAGFRPRAYANVEGASAVDTSRPAAARPSFFGITRAEAIVSLPGNSVRHIFDHAPPRFRLSASQRRLLWLALYDDSDIHLMRRLDVSVHGLKKLWRGIYERIDDRAPGFFGEASSDDEGKRGPEKRRQVLAYVRQRPEELRPWHG